jgi:putative acetyltransferase
VKNEPAKTTTVFIDDHLSYNLTVLKFNHTYWESTSNTQQKTYSEADSNQPEMDLVIEAENERDCEQISIITTSAFGRNAEAKLVENLRKTPEYVPELSLVAKHDNEIVGHVLFYPIKINTGKGKCVSLSLAPVSVLPNFQNRKVGSRLIMEGLERASKLGFKSVLVVGHAKYYPRFGFERSSKYGISAPFEVPDNAFLAIELEKGSLKNCSGTIQYPREFYDCIRAR